MTTIRLIALCLLTVGLVVVNTPANATEQQPDRIIVNGSEPYDLLTYDFMKTPFWETLNDPEMFTRWKTLMGGGMCTSLHRGYVATWEIKNAKLYLTQMRMENCGRGDVVPLTAFFPDVQGSVLASWYSGVLTIAQAPNPKEYIQFRVENGSVTGRRTISASPTDALHGSPETVVNMADRVYFLPSISSLDEEAQKVLRAQANWLKRYPAVRFNIEGHTDETEENVDDLSAKRAQITKEYLVAQGVAENRITTSALGSAHPVANAPLDQNRRAVSVITGGR
jgi:peptidoglycan-associated lipoprotein